MMMVMKTRIWSKLWFFGLIASFFICNLIFWSYHPRGGCDQSGNCTFISKVSCLEARSWTCIHPSYPKYGITTKLELSAPPPPAEAKLNPVLVQEIQPIKRPNTYIPGKSTRVIRYLICDFSYWMQQRVDQQKHKI